MNLISKLIQSVNVRYKSRRFISCFNRVGHIDKSTKLIVLGEFKYGHSITINGEGIDNFRRSQIVVLHGGTLQIGDTQVCLRYLSLVSILL